MQPGSCAPLKYNSAAAVGGKNTKITSRWNISLSLAGYSYFSPYYFYFLPQLIAFWLFFHSLWSLFHKFNSCNLLFRSLPSSIINSVTNK